MNRLFNSAHQRFATDAAFSQRVGGMLIDRLRDVKRENFERALWVGGGDAEGMRIFKGIAQLEARDRAVEGVIEQFPFEEASLDLIVVNGRLHVVNDLPGVLIQMRRALKPDGLFLCALPGGETLFELRDALIRVETQLKSGAASRVHPMVDLQTMAGLMQRAGFALPVVDAERQQIFYRGLRVLLRDIKNAGEGLALQERPPYPGKTFWDAVEKDYLARHADADGLLAASIEIIFAIGWGPSAAQPQPLKPGSAQNRLADALGSSETSLPDRAKPH
jgi:SAM-dependent methyltransferase